MFHGFNTEAFAKNIASVLKDDKKYKVTEPVFIISHENYKVLQIKKNLDHYLNPPKTVVVPPQPATKQPTPEQPNVSPPDTQQSPTDIYSSDSEIPIQATPGSSAAARIKPPGSVPKAESGKDSNTRRSTPK